MSDLIDFTQLFSETLARVRARFDADANAGLDDTDPAFIDTREGSFYWDVTQPPAMECARLWDAMTETAAAAFPSTAWGDYLDEHGQTFNLTRYPAYAAQGYLTFVTDGIEVLIAIGTTASSVASQTGQAITFQTIESGQTCAPLEWPDGVVVTPYDSGGSLAAGSRFYHVTALNQFGETKGSPDQNVPAVTASNVGRNDIEWQPVDGASSYQVYVTQDEHALGLRIGSTVATTFVDDGTIIPGGQEPQINTTSGIILQAQASQTGSAGNVAEGAVTVLNTLIDDVISVNNADRFAGGAEAESDDDFRTRILGEYMGTSGGGNVFDYKRWVTGQGIARVAVTPVWDGPGTVLVVIMQADGSPVLQSQINTIQRFLDPVPGMGQGQAPVGATVTVTTTTVVDIDIDAEVIPKAGYSLDGTGNTIAYRQSILSALNTYLTSLDPGDTVVYDHVIACFFVTGVFNLSNVVVNGQISDIVLASGTLPEVARLGNTDGITEPS